MKVPFSQQATAMALCALSWMPMAQAFQCRPPTLATRIWSNEITSSLHATEEKSFVDSAQDVLQTSIRIVQESQKDGASFTQLMANVLAGDYDAKVIGAKIDEEIQQSPCVMFTWERSPSCVKALEAFEQMGITSQVKVVRLDDPWDQGNPVRAEIGKRVGKSSVPMIFIGGKYVGGFDAGVSDEAPGIQSMAFRGTLRPALEEAGIKLSTS
mmetsp:Transcript_1449/g.3123  ORF Transcript_1449/g.3123 Transcript_1449/m.3123 type:complete len:212 (-) Transcript_1449:186-821(-)